MNKIFDTKPIYDVALEAYIGYGKTDLSNMTKKELENELDNTNREIDDINKEITDAESFPSYVLKEKLLNAEDYKKRIIYQIDNYKENKNTK